MTRILLAVVVPTMVAATAVSCGGGSDPPDPVEAERPLAEAYADVVTYRVCQAQNPVESRCHPDGPTPRAQGVWQLRIMDGNTPTYCFLIQLARFEWVLGNDPRGLLEVACQG